VALHFDGDKQGGDIVVITGTAQLMPKLAKQGAIFVGYHSYDWEP
jgi:hypothetical protein